MTRFVKCRKCGKGSAVKCFRLNPRNWREEYRILCRPCADLLGFTPVNHGHGYWNAA